VSWDKRHKKWEAYIGVNYKRVSFGYYATERTAMMAREAYIAERPELCAKSNLPA
jgi:hypothetical protein